MSLFFRGISIFGRFPFVRLPQFLDNPAYFLHIIKKNLVYKMDKTDYASMYAKFRFLSGQETLEELVNTGKSLARFSDGEIEILNGGGIYPPDSDWCQKWSPELGRDLAASLSCTDSRLLVAVDPPSTFLAQKNSVHHIRFEYEMWIDMRRLLWKYLSHGISYGHSHLFIKANCPDVKWGMIRSYLADKDVIVVGGNTCKLKHLKLGRCARFIECGTKNAYERKESIKKSICELIEREKLNKKFTIVLASLGPTACVLAHQLLDENIHVWDSGHIFELAEKNFIESIFV